MMTMPLNFYRKNKSWYANIPDYINMGGTEAECLMVGGAHTLIEALAHGKDSLDVLITPFGVLTAEEQKQLLSLDSFILSRIEESNGWGYYEIIQQFTEKHDILSGVIVPLCPVNRFVFGGIHPKTILIVVKE